ncbi:hypothetical protein NLG97_g14 [Lecanicillium saksenae]|uniref:Uncharacterized protein n=1 Tax=Lecanicillium saksenae TaxID=468837 RepID=A0ACC1R914_9HYPO|nr:hypothetical protein NLG97_g14 [Lecanicillium saksenae]
MIGRQSIIGVIAVAVFATLFLRQAPPPQHREYIRGQNNTALFIVAEHHGFSNVHLATSQSLLERYPGIQLHFASFTDIAEKVSRLSALAKKRQPQAQDITFHSILKGRSYVRALVESIDNLYQPDGQMSVVAPPGLKGLKQLVKIAAASFAPWSPEEHLAIHDELSAIIDEVDPAVVVLDTVFNPGIEATRGKNRLHAFITPNTLIDNFPDVQPYGKMLWKYPALGSGFSYPVPWYQIPMNIYLNAKIIYTILTLNNLKPIRKFLAENGVIDPVNFYGLHRPDVPWLTQTMPAASVPVDVVPQNVTCTGPIVLSPASAESIDPELVQWLRPKPTILVNLGSAFRWGIGQTEGMIATIGKLLDTSDYQILWKYSISPHVETVFDWQQAVKPLVDTGRVRVSTWLTVDPPALLQSGFISAFVTHGGANGYHEALEAGVPTVVLPMWVDLFNFAQLTEQIGVGVWACRDTSPRFDSDCLHKAIMRVADGGPESLAMRSRAKMFSDEARKTPGRDVAADLISKMATLQSL